MKKFDINNIKDRYTNKEITREEKYKLLEDYKNNPPINYNYTTLIVNISINTLRDIITDLDNEKFQIKFPYPMLDKRHP
jgi:hypothetical protein